MAPPDPMPPGTSFLFNIQEIRPNNTQAPLATPQGHWQPPNIWSACSPQCPPHGTPPNPLYRWREGKVSLVQNLAEATELHSHENCKHLYKCATVFTQRPSVDHFVAVPFDARRKNVVQSFPGRYVTLGFDHDEHPTIPSMVYSYLSLPGERETLATNGPTVWAENLFMSPQIPDAGTAPYKASLNAGLTGQLPLVLAVIAFSCRPDALDQVLTNCVKKGKWLKHNGVHGRLQGRGLVVTVWKDPRGHTSAEVLDQLEIGTYGPIFAPQ